MIQKQYYRKIFQFILIFCAVIYMNEIAVKWVDGLQFIGTDKWGHAVVIDSDTDHGGENTGFRPMELLLVALGACTGMDIVTILKKMKKDVHSLVIRVRGERAEEYPRYYKNIEIIYEISGTNLDKESVEKAIKLSEEKYCSVSANLREKKSEIKTTYKIIEMH